MLTIIDDKIAINIEDINLIYKQDNESWCLVVNDYHSKFFISEYYAKKIIKELQNLPKTSQLELSQIKPLLTEEEKSLINRMEPILAILGEESC